ncbi:MAG: DUF2971 domain-containing protein [Phycisphaerales bacterium]
MTIESPFILFKFKDVTGDGVVHVEDMLHNNRLWFSSPLEFNDPFDCRCVYDISNSRDEIVLRKTAFLARKGSSLSDALSQAENDIPQNSNDVEQWQRQQIKAHSHRAANTGILCLTPLCKNQLMWTHYAKWHTGVCIQFRVQEEKVEPHLEFICEAQPVEYADRCPQINFVRDDRVELFRKALLTKTRAYSYEEEWRIVRYDDGPGLKPIPKGIIGGIILGVNIEQTIEDRIIQACAEYDGDVEIVRASLDPETFGLQLNLERTV